jgi:hypothetical protein
VLVELKSTICNSESYYHKCLYFLSMKIIFKANKAIIFYIKHYVRFQRRKNAIVMLFKFFFLGHALYWEEDNRQCGKSRFAYA